MIGQCFSFRPLPWMASVLLMAAILLPAAGCLSLMPGHKEAELRKQAEADSFPTADKALGTPMVGTGNHSSTGN